MKKPSRLRCRTLRVGAGRSVRVSRLASAEPRGTPVLLVPGSFSGEWIWRDNFMRGLHRRGHEVYAMSHGAHGQRGWPLHTTGLQTLVDDLEAVVDEFPTPPRIVAHSLGGRLALELAVRRPLPALALLAPLPLDGGWRCMTALARNSPGSLAKLLAVAVEPRLTRLGSPPVGIYGPAADPARQQQITRRLQAESLRSLIEALFPGPAPTGPLPPLHFYAGGRDGIVPVAEVARAAATLGAALTVYPEMGHTFQCEPGHEQIVDDISDWFASLDDIRTRNGTNRAPQRRPTVRNQRQAPKYAA